MNRRLHLLGHSLEAVLAMLAAMFVLGAVLHLVTGSFLDDHPGIDAPVMAAMMAVGAADWMRYRGYDLDIVGELVGAAFAPVALLLIPYLLGLLSADALLTGMHVLMALFVGAVVLRHRDDFAGAAPRRLHLPGRPLKPGGAAV